MEISQRQGKILAAIVKEYSQSGTPVASEDLVDKYNFQVSSATIRNEMKALEEAGFIDQPHTSAGRIPTDIGYRYFVNKLMKHFEISAVEQKRLGAELRRLQEQYLELGRSLTKLLSEKTGGAAFALFPESVTASGLSNVIDESMSQKEIKELVRFMDEMVENRQTLLSQNLDDVEAFIGHESPMPLARDFSLLITRVKLPEGGHGVVGIVGPKRMKYARNMSLLEYISKLLSTGIGLIIFVNI